MKAKPASSQQAPSQHPSDQPRLEPSQHHLCECTGVHIFTCIVAGSNHSTLDCGSNWGLCLRIVLCLGIVRYHRFLRSMTSMKRGGFVSSCMPGALACLIVHMDVYHLISTLFTREGGVIMCELFDLPCHGPMLIGKEEPVRRKESTPAVMTPQ